MKRPPSSTMLIGHPLVATPLILLCAFSMLAAFVTSHGGEAMLILAIIMAVMSASRRASAYRAWKAEWDAMGGGPTPRRISLGRLLGGLLLVMAPLAAFMMRHELAYGAGYAVDWLSVRPLAMAVLGLVVLLLLLRFMRHGKPRKAVRKVVTVIARPALPVPTLADAYQALPPYCHDLLQGRS